MKKISPLFLCFIFGIALIHPQNKKNAGPETLAYAQEEIGVQGNWRKKKDWLKQAIAKNDAIQTMIIDVQQFKKIFYDKFKPVDGVLDTFYQQAGFDKGELEVLIKEIDGEIETTKTKTKELFTKALSQLDEETKEEAIKIKEQFADVYSIEEKFKQHKNNLEQFKMDINAIVELDKSLRTRLKTAEDQIDSIQTNVDEAEQLSKKIWHIIDDKKAKKIFYDLSSIHENTKALQEYIQQDLVQDFDNVITTLQNQIEMVGNSIDNLEQQGIIVKNRTARLEEERKKQQELLEQKKDREQKKEQKEIRKKRQDIPQTWYGLIWSGLTSLFSLIFSWFS